MTMRLLGVLPLALLALPGHAQSLSDAFNAGAALGRSGNAAARGQISGATAGATVPHFTTTPPQSSYFGAAGLGTPAAAQVASCASGAAAGGFADQACAAVGFSQTNPSRRPNYNLAPNDALLTRARAITADPQAIAGNLAGTYSACAVQTVTRPEQFDTQVCHQYRTFETTTCDKVLIVTATQTPGCEPGRFLTRVTADPCPSCLDYVAFDFSCGVAAYALHVYTIARATGEPYMEFGSLSVPGGLNVDIGKTPGPSRRDGTYCYETFYSQSCTGTTCTIGTWFANPCQGTSYTGVNTFAMPTVTTLTDNWDNRCAALEARSR